MTDVSAHHLLLLGAGFSRNWGGWLATEANEYLFGHPKIDNSIKDILLKHRKNGGFEAALADLEREGGSRLLAMQEALRQMFSDMDKAFTSTDFNFDNPGHNIKKFLLRFDAIFTLNQDLLLERYYVSQELSLINHRWNSCGLPGIRQKSPQQNPYGQIGTWVPDESPFAVSQGVQPYFKLHGSANWQTADSGELLVMGGNKTEIISKYPLLGRYHDEFRTRLHLANTKLMVIGYGFRDEHIDRTIENAVNEAELKLFIIDPLGSDVLDKNPGAIISAPNKRMKDLWSSLIGASRRSIKDIFGSDVVEFEKTMRFFD